MFEKKMRSSWISSELSFLPEGGLLTELELQYIPQA